MGNGIDKDFQGGGLQSRAFGERELRKLDGREKVLKEGIGVGPRGLESVSASWALPGDSSKA